MLMNTQCKNVTFNIKNIKYAGEVQTNRSFVWHWSYQIKIDIYNDKIFYVIPLVTKKKIQKLCSKYRKENEKLIRKLIFREGKNFIKEHTSPITE